MTQKLGIGLFSLTAKQYSIALILFLFLLGSHLLDYYPWIFVVLAAALIDWKKIYSKEIIILSTLLLSIYITWYFLDKEILQNYRLLGQGIILFIAYLLGISIPVGTLTKAPYKIKIIFYLIFAFFISYTLAILYSYIFIEQDHPLTGLGMYVCFQNEYKRLQVNGGHLISTILTYYLVPMSLVLPLILFYFGWLRKRGFYLLELLGLAALSLFVLYISAVMGRRIVYVLLGTVFLFLFLIKIFHHKPSAKHLKLLLLVIFIAGIAWYGYHHAIHKPSQSNQIAGVIVVSEIVIPIVKSDQTVLGVLHLQQIPVIRKLMHTGLKDKRFSWYSKGLGAMMNYPLGGGHKVWIVINQTKLTHNTWIDIGKDFGIVPFALSILWFVLHYYYLGRILLAKQVSEPVKNILLVMAVSFTAIMTIEPVFTSDKTFVAYVFFYFGFLKQYSDTLYSKKQKP